MAKPLFRTMLLFIAGISLLLPTFTSAKHNIMYSGQVAVLMYHHVHDTAESSSTITTSLFEEQLSFLRSKGYQFISLAEFRSYMEGGSVPDNAVLVTFDDGYKSFYDNAYPILKKMNIPAVNFIITETLDDPYGQNIPFLSREEIKAMTTESPGLINVQCHTHGLHKQAGKPYMTSKLVIDGEMETDDQYRDRIFNDTQECFRQLEPLSAEKIEYLAYPFGAFNATAKESVRQAGVQYAFTIVPRMATAKSDPLKIPRINAGNPKITPKGLHTKIMRRIVAVKQE